MRNWCATRSGTRTAGSKEQVTGSGRRSGKRPDGLRRRPGCRIRSSGRSRSSSSRLISRMCTRRAELQFYNLLRDGSAQTFRGRVAEERVRAAISVSTIRVQEAGATYSLAADRCGCSPRRSVSVSAAADPAAAAPRYRTTLSPQNATHFPEKLLLDCLKDSTAGHELCPLIHKEATASQSVREDEREGLRLQNHS